MEDHSASYYYPATSSFYPPPPGTFYPPPPPVPGVPQPPPPPPPYYQPPPLLPPPSYQQHQPPPPHFSVPQSQDELRTLFVAGLPDDVIAREIHNLFREFPGFRSSQLRRATESSRAFAFAVFTDQQSAAMAMQALNGLVFDLEKESTLYINFAKSNSKTKRSRTDDEVHNSPDKRVKGDVAYTRGLLDSGVGSNIHMPGMGNSAYSINGYPSTQSRILYDYGTTNPDKSNNKPCETLFVANLGPTCSEQELTELFSSLPGFSKLKMQQKNGLPVAFVDFKDVACSTGALMHVQGTLLYSSAGKGLSLEYAKSRMGQRGREKKK